MLRHAPTFSRGAESALMLRLRRTAIWGRRVAISRPHLAADQALQVAMLRVASDDGDGRRHPTTLSGNVAQYRPHARSMISAMHFSGVSMNSVLEKCIRSHPALWT